MQEPFHPQEQQASNFQEKVQQKNVNHWLYVIIFLIISVLFFGVAYFIFTCKQQRTPISADVSERASDFVRENEDYLIKDSQELAEKQVDTIDSHDDENTYNAYLIKLEKKDTADAYVISFDEVKKILISNQEQVEEDSVALIYDSQTQDPRLDSFDGKFYLFVKGKVAGSHFSNQQISFTVLEEVDKSLIPYFKEPFPQYCQTDDDCEADFNFCTYGVYNKYRYYHDVWGCGPMYDVEYDCLVESMDFESTACVDNQCVGFNKTVVCDEDADF